MNNNAWQTQLLESFISYDTIREKTVKIINYERVI